MLSVVCATWPFASKHFSAWQFWSNLLCLAVAGVLATESCMLQTPMTSMRWPHFHGSFTNDFQPLLP
jgi:hypothetical protein